MKPHLVIAQLRREYGFTQSELAHCAGVSLPSIQNIESGRMENPSWQTLASIFSVFGYTLSPLRNSVDWDAFSSCGAPLVASSSKSVRPTADLLLRSLRSACAELECLDKGGDREKMAVQAVLLALAEHYPKFFKKNCERSPLLMKFYPSDPSGPVIKLKRQVLSVLAGYL